MDNQPTSSLYEKLFEGTSLSDESEIERTSSLNELEFKDTSGSDVSDNQPTSSLYEKLFEGTSLSDGWENERTSSPNESENQEPSNPNESENQERRKPNESENQEPSNPNESGNQEPSNPNESENQERSNPNESENQEQSSTNESGSGAPSFFNESETDQSSSSNQFVRLTFRETKSELCLRVNSCCLDTSFLLQGMFISAAVVNLQERNKLDALPMALLILSLLLIALQFFSSLLFVWCRFKLHRIFGGVIAVFAILMQFGILAFAVTDSHDSVLGASISTSFVNLLFVISWSGSLCKFSDLFDKYVNQNGINRDSIKIPYLNILVSAGIVWNQALIGFLSIMLQLQNPFSSGFSNAIYFILIIIHLFCDIVLILKLANFRWLYSSDSIQKKSILIFALNLITFITFMILSYVGRSELSSLQLTILLIIIAVFFMKIILTTWSFIKAIRKRSHATIRNNDGNSQERSANPAPSSNSQFATTSL